MALYDKYLYIKKSNLPNAGKGLFTKVFIPKGAKITEYKGDILTWKEVCKKPDEGIGYVFYFNRNHVIDAWKTKKGVAHFANDARGLVRVTGLKNNSEYDTENNRCYIVATKDIPPKSEIFVEYGTEYWQVIRHNIRIDERAKRAKTRNNKKVNIHHLPAKRLKTGDSKIQESKFKILSK
jgi:SET domain-containing protein